MLALEPVVPIPVGFAMTDEIKEGPRHGGCGEARRLLLGHRDVDVRRVGMLHADDVVAGIDMQDLGGDAAGHVGQQIDGGVADLVGGDGAP
jgi:hypothetical protein